MPGGAGAELAQPPEHASNCTPGQLLGTATAQHLGVGPAPASVATSARRTTGCPAPALTTAATTSATRARATAQFNHTDADDR